MSEEPIDNIDKVLERIEVSESCYQLATDRYQSIAEHLNGEKSSVAKFEPQLYPQGSFRLGTAIRPIGENEEYDIDLVCELSKLTKSDLTQYDLRSQVRKELDRYARENAMNDPPEDRKRCVTLHYAGAPSFHVDVLPSLPEDRATIVGITISNVLPEHAEKAIALTDKTHQYYHRISSDWPSSNPRAYGEWFEAQMRPLMTFREQKSITAVPTYRIKTPLQSTVQVLKRHCRSYFFEDMTYMPISMILTTLAANLYRGEATLQEALAAIVSQLPGAVSQSEPEVLNPVNPNENFADKWTRDSNYHAKFEEWAIRLNQDLNSLLGGSLRERKHVAHESFRIPGGGIHSGGFPAVHVFPSPVSKPSGQQPWRR